MTMPEKVWMRSSIFCVASGGISNLDDIAALRNDDWRSLYLLGCLYYDRMNYAAAVSAWDDCMWMPGNIWNIAKPGC